jgi:hypothetical protein
MRRREKARERAREWRRNNPDKVRAQKDKGRADNYFRPFVAIDSEGQNYAGDDVLYQGVRYPRHDTYLWGAAADDGREPVWLTAAETHAMDKRPLSVVEILDWLLDLRRQYRKAVFIMFSFKLSLKLLSILTISRPGKYINMKHIPPKPALYLKLTTRPFFGKNMRFTILMESISIFTGWRTPINRFTTDA